MQARLRVAIQGVAILLLLAVAPPTALPQAAGPNDAQLAKWREQLRSEDPSVRGSALEEQLDIGLGAAAVAPQLVEMLGDEQDATIKNSSMRLRNYARDVLVKIGPAAADEVIKGLAHQNRLVRMGAAEVLGEMREARAVAPLVAMLGDDDREVAGHATTALTNIGEPAIEPVVVALTSEDVRTRSYAAATLGSMRDRRVVRPVARLLYDEDKIVRQFATNALRDLALAHPLGTTWRPANANGEDAAAGKARAEQDAALRAIVLDELIAAMKSDHQGARLAAAECAYYLSAPELVQALAKCATAGDQALRLQAVRTLSVIDSGDVFAALVERLKDPVAEIRAAAAIGLRFRAELTNDKPQIAKPLLAALDDPDQKVRLNAIEALGQIPLDSERSAARRLIDFVKGDDAELAAAAMQSLVRLGAKEAVEPIFKLVSHPTLGPKAAAAMASFDDRRAIEPLRAHLATKDPNVIQALGTMKDRDSVEPLLALLTEAEDSNRWAVIRSLGSMGDPRAVEPLIRLLKSEQRWMHEVANALAEIKDPRAVQPLIDSIRSSAYRSHRFPHMELHPQHNPVAGPLLHIGYASVEPLAAALKDESDETRSVAAWVLYNLASQGGLEKEDMQPAVEPLAAALADRSPIVRHHAALALGALGDARAVDALLQVAAASGDPDGTNPYGVIYGSAAAYLSRLRDPRAVEPLIKLLGDHRPGTRSTAARGLGYLNDPRAIAPLLAVLKDEDPQVRSDVARALGTLGNQQAVEPLIEALKVEDASVRAAAAEGLGRLGDPRAAEALANLLEGSDFRVRVNSAIALVRLNDPRGLESIAKLLKVEDATLREQAITELATSFLREQGLTAPLIEALSDPEVRVRIYAAGALGRIGNEAAVEALLAKLTDRENLRSVLQALSQTRDERALAVLIRHLEDEDADVRLQAAYGVAAFGGKDGVEPLIRRLSDPSPEVRIEVIRALATLRASDAEVFLEAATLDEDPNDRSQAQRSLRKLQSP